MGFKLAEDAIQAKVTAEWTRPAVPIFWLSEGVVVPTGPYAMCFVEGHKESIIAFGRGRGQNEYMTYGTVMGFFFVPLGAPISLARDMRDEFCNILRSQRFSGISFYGVSPIGGDSQSDRAKHINVQALAEFEYRFRG
jgi:hypothetical protein